MKHLAKIREKSAGINRIRREKGWLGIKIYLEQLRWKYREKKKYRQWLELRRLTENKRREMLRQIESFPLKPKISVVMPVYNVDEKWLRLCLESVINQLYGNWELCIADDASTAPHIKKVLLEYAARDERIKIVFRPENGHISAASNSALELATGQFAALLDHDDELAEDALFYVAKEINEFPDASMIYSDEDLIDEKGRRHSPKFKPDWSVDLFYSLNLITHLSVYKTEILRRIGGFRLGAEGSQDYDLALRFVEQIRKKNIRHIPRVLYHWRAIRGSVAFSSDEKPYAHERARDALRAHLERIGKKAKVSRAIANLHRVRYDLPAVLPKVSLILQAGEDSAAAERSVKTFVERTDYGNLEIVLVLKTVPSAECRVQSDSYPNSTLFLLRTELDSEAARLNFAAARTDGEILCFVDINQKPLAADWLAELTSFACQKEIGAVGAKLLDADEQVAHGGLIVGAGGAVGVAHRGLPRDADGNFLRAQLVNNFSAVSVSCLAVRREAFEAVGGFDQENLPETFFDADFCLKLREKNYRIVFTPYAELIQTDEKKRPDVQKDATAAEKDFFVRKWRRFVGHDPFYNPNLSYESADFSIDI